MTDNRQFILSPGPHLKAGMTTAQIMWWVSASLIPVFIWAVCIFGFRVVALTASGVAGAVFGEWLSNRLRRQKQTIKDGSAVLTGLLLTGTLSPGLPFWMPATGGFTAVIFAKMLFGGLGYSIFNPALIGRAFLMAAFPVAMTTTWLSPEPGRIFSFSAVTQATPLNAWKLEGIIPAFYDKLLLGFHAGSIGEVSVLLIMLGGAVLLFKKIITMHIPVSVICGLFLVSLFSGVPFFHLLTGGLWFGAIYMATDYVTAPLLPVAQIIFGALIGVITGVIRLWGGYPEGICYAILIMNAVTPALNHWFKPKRPGWEGTPS